MSGGSKKQTVGYRYYMGMHFGLCHGPVDSIGEIRCGDRTAWQGTVQSNQTISIDVPNLFGGDEREGGVQGSADIMFGEPDQTANSYLASKISALMPAFRGIVGVVFKGGKISSNNPYIKPWAFKLTRMLAGWNAGNGGLWQPSLAAIWQIERPVWTYKETAKFRVSYTDTLGWGGLATQNYSSLIEALAHVIDKESGAGALSATESSSDVAKQTKLDYIFGTALSVFGTGGSGSGLQWEDTKVRFVITYIGTTNWTVDIDRITQSEYFAAKQLLNEDGEQVADDVSGAQMNPAHIIYQCLTDPDWGMGYPVALIDDDAFTDAAQALYDEGFGLSLIWNQQTKIGDFIKVVLDHIGAVLYADPKTGKFVLKLIRDDYDAGTLEVFDESNIAALETFQRAGYGETVNEITVVYTDDTTDKDAAITVQDLANIQAQGAVVAQTRQYPGIRIGTLAARVAERDLIAASTPLAKARIRVNRNAWSQAPGGVVKLSWPKLGIDELICRVLAVNYGTLTDGAMTIELAEDVFGLPESSYVQQQPGEWEEPNTAPAEATLRVVAEAGYYELQQSMGAAELAALADDAGFLSTAAARPSSDALDYGIQTDSGSGYSEGGRGDFCPTGTLVDAIGHTDTAITIENIVDGDLVDAGTWARLGTEIVRIDAWNADTGAATIGRGVLDTVAAAHASGTRLYFLDGFTASDNVERVDAETFDVKLLPKTGTGELALADATADTVTFDQRMFRPYPPGQMEINGEAYPEELIEPGSVTVSWAHRDRLTQNLEGDESGNIGPEAGTTYTVTLKSADTDTTLITESGITATSWAAIGIEGNFNMRVLLKSVRDGLDSRQQHDYTFWYERGPFLDPDWASVILLIGAEASPVVDESAAVRSVTLTSATRSSTQAKMGSWSIYSGANNHRMTFGNGDDFEFGTGDFTVEWFHYRDSNTGNQVHLKLTHSGDSGFFGIYRASAAGTLIFYGPSNTTRMTVASGDVPALNTWAHYAVTRSGNVFRFFINGVQKATTTQSLDWTTANAITASWGDAAVTGAFRGYVDEIRVTKGVARYTADFTPPLFPLPRG